MGKVLELPALHKDGNEFPVELSLAPVRLRREWHAVGIVRDITSAGGQSRCCTTAKRTTASSSRARRTP